VPQLPELRVRLGAEVRPGLRPSCSAERPTTARDCRKGLLGLGRSELSAGLLLVGAEQVELREVPARRPSVFKSLACSSSIILLFL
jgi:hypothetical protein